MSEKDIFNYLVEIGCCYNCCIRYLNLRCVDFSDSKSYLTKNEYILTDNFVNEPEINLKKVKTNPCIVCLGLLQDFTINDILSNNGLLKTKNYDSKVFTCSISMPACIMIREYNVRIHLREMYPNYFNEDKEEIPLNRAWKIFVKNKISEYVNKTFENSDTCNFSINITLDYEDDTEELKILCKMQPKTFEERKTQHRKYNGELFSRKAVLSVLTEIPLETFKKHASIPPPIPNKGLFCKSIECKHNPIYLAGRYCKFSRELSQSPWIIDGVKAMETSVQEIIFDGVFKEFGIGEDLLKFSSSGREDCDVRCLGKGRPFYLEISNPKRTMYSFEEFKNLQNKINESTLIKVRDMQIVPKIDLTKIKEGEEAKTKDYVALCIVKSKITEELINKLNSIETLDIEQKTPIRVLHRRPLAIRKKKIHKMEAKLIPSNSNLFELYVQTQAGTYVKEFVHGDFGRTSPSICEILNMEVDIIALDVVAINLDWPKEIDYETLNDQNME